MWDELDEKIPASWGCRFRTTVDFGPQISDVREPSLVERRERFCLRLELKNETIYIFVKLDIK